MYVFAFKFVGARCQNGGRAETESQFSHVLSRDKKFWPPAQLSYLTSA
jgi:hypothetical protein